MNRQEHISALEAELAALRKEQAAEDNETKLERARRLYQELLEDRLVGAALTSAMLEYDELLAKCVR